MSSPIIQPYLFFAGRCQEALDFYRTAMGAQIEMLLLYKDSPEPPPPGAVPPGFEDKVMHASVRIGNSVLMASDGCSTETGFSGFSLSLTLPTQADARRVFAALSEDGNVGMPIGKTFWSPCFGMVTDRFGVGWMVTVPS